MNSRKTGREIEVRNKEIVWSLYKKKKRGGGHESVAVFCQESVERAIVSWNSLYYSIKALMKGEALY